jgi:NAD-dependent deacetylase
MFTINMPFKNYNQEGLVNGLPRELRERTIKITAREIYSMDNSIQTLKQWVAESNNIVFFGGAGVSTESGIPDFRSVDGLYSQKYDYPPEKILSHSFFMAKTEEFYKFYHDKMIVVGVKPNRAHLRLAELEQDGKLKAVITQNIDGLHQLAGSKKVLELHGSTHRNYCMSCGNRYGFEAVSEASGVPRCTCGGIIRPDVVLYEESLDTNIVYEAVRLISAAEILIVGGTSLKVGPAVRLVGCYSGNKLVFVNKDTTRYDTEADLLITDKIGEVFAQL